MTVGLVDLAHGVERAVFGLDLALHGGGQLQLLLVLAGDADDFRDELMIAFRKSRPSWSSSKSLIRSSWSSNSLSSVHSREAMVVASCSANRLHSRSRMVVEEFMISP